MLEMRGIYKRYGPVCANRNIDLMVPPGKIVGLLGENGSGKSTLMKVLFGIVRADAGTITYKGRALAGHTPRESIAAGIGMIHQHFMLVDAMTVTENIMLGWTRAGRWLRPREIAELIVNASHTYGLDIDPHTTVGRLPYGTRQRVEIMKAILRGADLLVLDEPTSNFSPPEVGRLLEAMRRLREQGRSVIFISHKLGEVLDICDDVVVLRDGEVTGRCTTAGATRAELAHMMVGRNVATPIDRVSRDPGPEILGVAGLSRTDESGIERLREVSFTIRAGEILAVAGVDGNGQTDLVDAIAGLQRLDQGRVSLCGRDITRWSVQARLAAGLSYIPVDRSGTSIVPGMTVEDNLALREFNRTPLSRWCRLDRGSFRALAASGIARFGIRTGGPDAPARTLSGGNQQKIVVAREVGRNPKVLLAFQPTWGLDLGATRFVIEQVLALREAGGAVLYISAELEEVLSLGDRIAVMYNGRLSEPVRREEADRTGVGLMMGGFAPTRRADAHSA
jgi:general nucleoside transport system ATP-binding protein